MATKPFQFRLRTLLLAVVPVAVIALPVGYYLRRPAPVHACGIVNLDGTPFFDARVKFWSIDPDGCVAEGLTDKAGAFMLQTLVDTDPVSRIPGAVPGSYTVSVRRFPGVPLRYGYDENSGLTAEVTKDGPNVFVFNLTTMPKN